MMANGYASGNAYKFTILADEKDGGSGGHRIVIEGSDRPSECQSRHEKLLDINVENPQDFIN